MKIVIDSKELSKLINDKFIGDCEFRTACYKHCNDRDENGNSFHCHQSIERTLLEYLEQNNADDLISRKDVERCCLNGWNKDYKEILNDIRKLPIRSIEMKGEDK